MSATIIIEPRAATIETEVDDMGRLRVVPDQIVRLGVGGGLRSFAANQYYLNVLSALGSAVVGYWPLWEPSGSTAADISGNGRNGAYTNVTLGQTGIGDGKTSAKFVTTPASKMNPYSAGMAAAANLDEGFVSAFIAIDDVSLWADATSYVFAFLTIDFTSGIVMRKSAANTLTVYRRKAAQVASIMLDCPTTARWVHIGFAWSVAQGKNWAYINGVKKIPTTVALNAMAGALAAAGTVFGSGSGATNNWPGRMAHVVWGAGIPANLDAAMYTAANSVGQVVFDGDSRSADKNWTTAAVEAAYASGDFVAGKRGVATWAVTGQTVATMLTNGPTNIDPLIKSANNTIVIWGGINDNGASTAQQIYDNLAAYCTARKAAGWNKVIVCTEIDSTAAGWNAKYQALNTLIRASHAWADAVADLGADARLQNASDGTYYTDGTHLTAAGYAVVAGIVGAVLAA